jgi:hypothetical protein
MKSAEAYDIVGPLRLASAGLPWQVRLDGNTSIMPSGHNGPYKDLESPLRNTAHWLATFSIAWSLSGKREFRDIGNRLTNYLVRHGAHHFEGALLNRQKPGKDWCNGTIGYAWIIEALVRAGWYLERDDARDEALRLADLLPFDEPEGLWNTVDPIRRAPYIDGTYNHQSWLAAALAELGGKPAKPVSRFLDASVERHFGTETDGLIRHHTERGARGNINLSKIRSALSQKLDPGAGARARFNPRIESRSRAVGYHLYVLFSLARLYRHSPEHALFASDSFREALRFAAEPAFRQELGRSPFSYDYNAPGFEYLLIVRAFGELEPALTLDVWEEAFEEQKRRTYCEETGLFSRASDPATVAARVYELVMGVEFDVR